MKKILFVALSLLFVFACKNQQDNGNKPYNKTEEFAVNFDVENKTGGTITARIKAGKDITSGKKVAKGTEVIFTAEPTDSIYSIESWLLNGTKIDETDLNETKMEYTLKIEKETNVLVKFKTLEGFVAVRLNGKNIVGKTPSYELPGKKPEWNGCFITNRTVKLSDYAMAEKIVTYELWYETYIWAKENGYTFANEGREGSVGVDGEAPTTNKKHPVTKVSWRDSIIWCNAHTQKTKGEAFCVYRDKNDHNKILKNATEATQCDEAFADIEKTGFRLPTEAEWEFASRFQGDGSKEEHKQNAESYGDGIYLTLANSASGAKKPVGFNGVTLNGTKVELNDYPKWEELRDEAAKVGVFGEWYCGDKSYLEQNPSISTTLEVATKAPNYLGLYDMNGNVWEWVFDGDDIDVIAHDNLYKKDGIVVNPLGKPNSLEKGKRGASWFYSSDCLTVCLRDVEEANYKFDDTGFRLAFSIR